MGWRGTGVLRVGARLSLNSAVVREIYRAQFFILLLTMLKQMGCSPVDYLDGLCLARLDRVFAHVA